MSHKLATFIAGLLISVVGAQALGAFGGGSPNVLSPGPFWLVLIAWSEVPLTIILSIPALLFWVWHPNLFKGSATVPLRTLVLFAVVLVLSTAGFIAGWQYGVQYQGREYALICLTISSALMLVTGYSLWLGRKTPSFGRALSSHAFLFSWFSSYAFPYLGETP